MGDKHLSAKIATLTTDFGLKDPYAAEMKAVILSICPMATIVDITHEVEKFNARMGAYILASAAQYFPKDTIHVAVVDPGVGTQRQPILIQTKQGLFVGPDNGVLVLAAHKQEIVEIRQIANRKFMLPKVSNTFHGRDIFAPVAAYLLIGIPPPEFGPIVNEFAKPNFTCVTRDGSALIGEVLHIDGFGNIITNICREEMKLANLEKSLSVDLDNRQLRLEMSKTYGDVKFHQAMALFGSHGYLEIAVNQDSAAKALSVNVGDKIRITET